MDLVYGIAPRATPLAVPAGILVRAPSLAATWECDLSDNRLRWSPGVFELFGLDPTRRPDRAETVAMYCAESRDELAWRRADAIANRTSFTFDARIRRLDGDLRWMRLSADVVWQGGRATLLYGTKRDITDELPAG